MGRPTKVIIVDDQSLCREGLRELMKHWPEFSVVGEAANGQEAIEACGRLKPDMVLMDVQMPVMDGVEATRKIAQIYPDISVIMLTVAVDDESLFGALRCGAQGYVLKDTPSKELRERLQGAVRGETPLSGIVATKVVEQMKYSTAQNETDAFVEKGVDYTDVFTLRETEVLKLVAAGLSNAEIGAQLYLGSGTVKKHLSCIMQKTGLENRVQVATFAYKAGFMDQ